MKQVSIIVRAEWDEEAQVWVATSNDIDGLAVEADTLEALKQRVTDAVCDLIDVNGVSEGQQGLPEIPIHIMSEQLARVPNPCH